MSQYAEGIRKVKGAWLRRRLAPTYLCVTTADRGCPGAPGKNAPEDKRLPAPWNDALVPRHRSQADWLVDVGWKTYDEVFGPFPTHAYQVEDEEHFIPLGYYQETSKGFFLRYRSEHAYFWFERGTPVDPTALEATARFFEEHIWPPITAIMARPRGIDGTCTSSMGRLTGLMAHSIRKINAPGWSARPATSARSFISAWTLPH
jgi:hypothetical protein